ncbi:unnamed protein product, partial [Lampetra fluviatilis]
VSVSRAIKPFAEPGRPPDWFSQKHCASQYSELLETTETPKRKRGERGEVVETIEDVIVKKLTVERIEELTKSIRDIQERYKKLKHELELVQNGQLDHNLHEIWNDIVARKKQDEEEAEAKRKAVEEAYQARMAIKNAPKRPLASIRTLSADPTTTGLDSPSSDVASGSDVVMAQPPLGGIAVTTPAVSSPVTSTPTAAPGVDDSLAKKAATIDVQKPSPPQSPLTELLRKNGIPSFGTVTSVVPEAARVEVQPLAEVLTEQPQVEEEVVVESLQQALVPQVEEAAMGDGDGDVLGEMEDGEQDIDIPLGSEEEKALLEEQSPPSHPEPPPEVNEEIAVEAAKLSPPVEPVPQVKCEAADPPAEQLASPKVQAHTSPQPTSPVTQPKDETEIQAADPATEGVVEDVEQKKNEQPNLEATAQTEPLVDVENKREGTTEASEEVETHQIPDIVPEEEEDDEVTVKKDEPEPEGSKQEQARIQDCRPMSLHNEAGSIEEERSETDILEVMEHGASESEDGSSMHNTLHMPSTSLTDSVPNSPASSQFSIGSEDPEALQAQKIWKKSIMLVWRAAANHKYANVFLQPVTNDIAPGYHSIVHRPMDLSTIKKNIENGAIRTTAEFQRDVMLMFQNAIMYNSSDHDVFHMAVEMQRDVMEHVQQFLATQLIMQTSESSVGAKVLRGRDPAKKQESLEKDILSMGSPAFLLSLFDVGTRGRRSAIEADMKMKK